jgi:hypothetical protein
VATDDSPIGSIGPISTPTRGKAGPGEVVLKIRGGTETFIAWSRQPLARGTLVLVIGDLGYRAVEVETLDPLEFLSGADSTPTDSPH